MRFSGGEFPLRRVLWSVPATLIGAIVYGACLAAGTADVALGSIIRSTVFIHAAAWGLFIAPFALAVSEHNALYKFPFAVFYGAIFGAAAFFLVAAAVMTLNRLPLGLLLGETVRFALPCALSGASVAAVMSLMVPCGRT